MAPSLPCGVGTLKKTYSNVSRMKTFQVAGTVSVHLQLSDNE